MQKCTRFSSAEESSTPASSRLPWRNRPCRLPPRRGRACDVLFVHRRQQRSSSPDWAAPSCVGLFLSRVYLSISPSFSLPLSCQHCHRLQLRHRCGPGRHQPHRRARLGLLRRPDRLEWPDAAGRADSYCAHLGQLQLAAGEDIANAPRQHSSRHSTRSILRRSSSTSSAAPPTAAPAAPVAWIYWWRSACAAHHEAARRAPRTISVVPYAPRSVVARGPGPAPVTG